MARIVVYVFIGLVAVGISSGCQRIPARYLGRFTDDYGSEYQISREVWLQDSSARYQILDWNTDETYIIARNDTNNPAEPGLYTRIDYVKLKDMAPFKWGYCYTVYEAQTEAEARNAAPADKKHPKSGCNGYPFSRMQRVPKPFY